MKGFHFILNMADYFDFDNVYFWRTSLGYPIYELSLISKATGEIISISLTEDYFDMLLEDIASQLVNKACEYLAIGMEE